MPRKDRNCGPEPTIPHSRCRPTPISSLLAAEMSIFFQFVNECKPIVKEALSCTFLVGNFLCLLHVTDTYLCSPILVYGSSMLPMLNLTGDVLLIEHLSTLLGKVERSDVVVVKSPENPRKSVTKRVVAMGGESFTFLVPKGHVWIQGDNIYASRHSRQFGPVPYGLNTPRSYVENGLEIMAPLMQRWAGQI